MLGPGESCGCHRGRQPPHRNGGSRGKEYLNVTLLLPSRLLTSPPTGQTLQDTREQESLIPVWVRHVRHTTAGEGKGDRGGVQKKSGQKALSLVFSFHRHSNPMR